MENYICIHAHFYQPPRENPWLEAIEYQQSAYPYHDWNRRITAECYHPNGVSHVLDKNGLIERIVNNYSRISFDFGPTLLSWLEVEDPATYGRIIEADRESRERFSGHGSALAQAYNHAILPLCNHRDKITQIRWGIKDFSRRFGRQPEGMWIPETAVDLETLDLMAQEGLKFAILAPRQARRVRKRGERAWSSISNQSIDPTMAYEIGLPTGRSMALFFYDGPISLAVGFEKLLSDGGAFVDRLTGAFSAEPKWPQIVHIATDGETFGHHHSFGDMALAYALSSIESGTRAARLTNYAEYLEKHPPTHLVDIWENTSWSCPHEIGRWREDCGCSTGAHPGWQQKWRAPLRAALDWLQDHLEGLYDNDAARLVKDPWAARNDYIDVILDRSPDSVEHFLAAHRTHELSAEERIRVLKLLELQRHAMLMYTSCGWFFDDISGIETIQILQYAGRAIQLGEELFGENNIEPTFCDMLQKAPSNDPELKNGRAVYQKFVTPAMVDRQKVAGHYAVRLLFQDYPERSEFYSYIVDRKSSNIITSGRSRLAVGRCRITSGITSESSELEYAVVHSGELNISGGVREFEGEHSEREMIDAMTGTFEKADLPAVFRHIDEYFGQSTFSLGSLFRDEQRRVLDAILKSINADLEELNRLAFERTAPLMRIPVNLGLALPRHFLSIAGAVLNSQLLRAFQAEELNADHVMDLLQDAKFWRVDLDKEGLEYALRETIEKLAQQSRDHPGDLPSLRNFAEAVRLTTRLPFRVNFYQTQNIYYDLLKNRFPELKAAAEKGEKKAGIWIAEFKELGTKLSFKID